MFMTGQKNEKDQSPRGLVTLREMTKRLAEHRARRRRAAALDAVVLAYVFGGPERMAFVEERLAEDLRFPPVTTRED